VHQTNQPSTNRYPCKGSNVTKPCSSLNDSCKYVTAVNCNHLINLPSFSFVLIAHQIRAHKSVHSWQHIDSTVKDPKQSNQLSLSRRHSFLLSNNEIIICQRLFSLSLFSFISSPSNRPKRTHLHLVLDSCQCPSPRPHSLSECSFIHETQTQTQR